MKFRIVYTHDSSGRKIIFEEYIGKEPYERFKRLMLPQVNDRDVLISTKKHGEKTLGDLYLADPDYLKWTVCKSKQSKSIKYAAIRLLYGLPYEVPEDGLEYDIPLFFDWKMFESIARQLDLPITI